MNPLTFAAAGELSPEELEARLGGLGLRRDPVVTTVRRTYYDTFDSRLYRAGWVLEHECPLDAVGVPSSSTGGSWLRLRPLGAALAVLEQPVRSVPRRVEDLTDEQLRSRVGALAGGRALLAVVDTAPTREQTFRCLGPEDKTVARVVVARAVGSGDAAGPAPAPALWAVPIRGYDDELAAVVRSLAPLFGEASAADAYEVASRSIGRLPGLDPSAFDVSLDASASADAGLRALLARLLEVIVVNEPGVRGDLDDEFLHDFRVAVRRARSVLSAARGVLAEDERLWLAGELRWLGQLTSPPRDLDVLLDDLAGAVDDEAQADLAPFVAELRSERRRARAALIAGLDSERYQLLLAGARRLVTTVGSCPLPAPELVERRLHRATRRLLRQGRAAVTAEEWHEVRKAGKRLRYVIEGFRSLLGAEAAEALGSLKRLQSILGDAQDRAAHAALIREVALRWAATSPPTSSPSVTRGLVAAGGLVERHRSRGVKVQAQATAAFAAFDTKENRARLRGLLAGDPDPTPPGPGDQG